MNKKVLRKKLTILVCMLLTFTIQAQQKVELFLDLDDLELSGNSISGGETFAEPSCGFNAFASALKSIVYTHQDESPVALEVDLEISVKGRVKVKEVSFLHKKEMKLYELDKHYVKQIKKLIPSICTWQPDSINENGKIKAVKSKQKLLIVLRSFTDMFNDDDIEVYPVLPAPPVALKQNSAEQNQDKIFSVVENMPIFGGSDEALATYLKDNFVVTKEAKKYEIKGRILIVFVVREDGSITDVKPLLPIDRQLGYGLEEQGVKLIQNMPNWEPGKQRNKTVAVRMVLPIIVDY